MFVTYGCLYIACDQDAKAIIRLLSASAACNRRKADDAWWLTAGFALPVVRMRKQSTAFFVTDSSACNRREAYDVWCLTAASPFPVVKMRKQSTAFSITDRSTCNCMMAYG